MMAGHMAQQTGGEIHLSPGGGVDDCSGTNGIKWNFIKKNVLSG